MEKWQLQDAKNKFSEVIDKACRLGPQCITRRGVETAVVLSVHEYKKLVTPKTNLVDFFHQSPLYGIELDLERDKTCAREFEF